MVEYKVLEYFNKHKADLSKLEAEANSGWRVVGIFPGSPLHNPHRQDALLERLPTASKVVEVEKPAPKRRGRKPKAAEE